MFFGRDGFMVHGIGRDGFRSMVLDVSACINMYYNIERNIMKNQAGSPGFGIEGKISMYMCFMCYALALFILCVLEFVCRQFLYRVKTYIWYQSSFCFKGTPLLLRGFTRAYGRPCSVGYLRDRFS